MKTKTADKIVSYICPHCGARLTVKAERNTEQAVDAAWAALDMKIKEHDKKEHGGTWTANLPAPYAIPEEMD